MNEERVEQLVRELLVEIGGLTPNQEHDQVNISNRAVLDGILNITLIDGFSPSLGDTFEIMTFGTRIGEFDTVAGTELSNGLYFGLDYGAERLVLTAIPEPATLGLLVIGGLALLGRR